MQNRVVAGVIGSFKHQSVNERLEQIWKIMETCCYETAVIAAAAECRIYEQKKESDRI